MMSEPDRRCPASSLVSVALALVLACACSRSHFLTLDAQGHREYDQCVATNPVAIPEGIYTDPGISLDYQRLVPMPDPRTGVDTSYTVKTIKSSARLEQVYHDARHGNQRAALFVCMAEAGMRSFGRQAARFVSSPQCLTVARCMADFDRLELSKTTYSGRRLRAIFGHAFAKQAHRLQMAQQVIANALAMVMAGKVAMGLTAPARSVPPAPRPQLRTDVAQRTPSRGGAGPVRAGQAAENAVRRVYDIGQKKKITVNGRRRIPDGITDEVLSEVKNVKSLSFTRQLKDFRDFAKNNDLEFHLYVRYDTTLSRPLLDAVRAGEITLRYIP